MDVVLSHLVELWLQCVILTWHSKSLFLMHLRATYNWNRWHECKQRLYTFYFSSPKVRGHRISFYLPIKWVVITVIAWSLVVCIYDPKVGKTFETACYQGAWGLDKDSPQVWLQDVTLKGCCQDIAANELWPSCFRPHKHSWAFHF